ncbi:hypothetical protein FA346_26245 [Pseudomonas aeruginosa]|nr:hypothetical protein [Pseudomonas aeruginosa]HBP1969508.1 hypothetical protein [Pseudomonas aeruginosa]
MNSKHLLALALAWALTSTAWGGTYEWTSGWGQGVSEYQADDGNGNALSISCPDHEGGYISAYADIAGKAYSSDQEGGFDVIADGVLYSNPFFTDCRVCAANFPGFWKALRQANNLQISAEGRTVNLPTKNLEAVLRPLDDPHNSCTAAW